MNAMHGAHRCRARTEIKPPSMSAKRIRIAGSAYSTTSLSSSTTGRTWAIWSRSILPISAGVVAGRLGADFGHALVDVRTAYRLGDLPAGSG